MVLCKKCGNRSRNDLKFCSICGADLPQASEGNCSNCGASLKPGTTFCTGCGMDINSLPKESAVTESSSKENAMLPSCTACGAILKEGAQFCSSCGAVRD